MLRMCSHIDSFICLLFPTYRLGHTMYEQSTNHISLIKQAADMICLLVIVNAPSTNNQVFQGE